jgi:hypothetical protein
MPPPFQNSDTRRRLERTAATEFAAATRIMRDIRNLSGRRSPQTSQLRAKVSDLLRIAQRSGNTRAANELRLALNRLQGTLSARAVQQLFDSVLAISGTLGRAARVAADVGRTVAAAGRAIDANLLDAESVLQTLRGTTTPESVGAQRTQQPPPQRTYQQSGPPMPLNTRMLPNGLVRVQTPNFNRTYRPTDPTITGAMIPVTSSNVYAIGYNFSFNNPTKGILYVQFLGGGEKGNRKRSGPGHLYEYYDIHPDKFQQMRQAASKGGWVWDELRVRGSRVMHKVRYNLKAFAGGNLPRRAAVVNGRQMLIPRVRQGRAAIGERVQTYRSALPRQDLGPVRRGRPNNGRPNNSR